MSLLSLLITNQKYNKNSKIGGGYLSLFMDNPDPIFIMDSKGKLLAINHKITTLLGYSIHDKEVFKRNLTQTGDLDKIRYHFHKAAQGRHTSFDLVLRHKKGHEIPLNITFIPNFNETRLVSIFGLCRDMSEKQAIEVQLEKSESLLQIGDRSFTRRHLVLRCVEKKNDLLLERYRRHIWCNSKHISGGFTALAKICSPRGQAKGREKSWETSKRGKTKTGIPDN